VAVVHSFRLRYRAHDVELPPGEFVVGRGEECQLSIDDAMVSRRHVTFRVSSASVTIVDLGSRNGVAVNGTKIKSERRLADGDRITIGKHELFFSALQSGSFRVRGPMARTLGAVELQDLDALVGGTKSALPSSAAIARVIAAFHTLAALADKSFALGRPEDAERILAGPLTDLQKEIRRGAHADSVILGRFSSYALRLAADLEKSTWVDWIFDVYQLETMLLPSSIIDALLTLAPRLKHLEPKPILDYVQTLSSLSGLTPNEKFLLQRLEGLTKRLTTEP